jgi:hypothetical protein
MSELEPLLSVYELANIRAEIRKFVQSALLEPLTHRQLYAGGGRCYHAHDWQTFVLWLNIDRAKADYPYVWEKPDCDYDAFRPTEDKALQNLYYGEPPPPSNTARLRVFKKPPRVKKSKDFYKWHRNGKTAS